MGDVRRIHRVWRHRSERRWLEPDTDRLVVRDAAAWRRDEFGHVLEGDGTPIRWTHCIACGESLAEGHSQVAGFEARCYVRLDRDERRRLYDRAVEVSNAASGRSILGKVAAYLLGPYGGW